MARLTYVGPLGEIHLGSPVGPKMIRGEETEVADELAAKLLEERPEEFQEG